MGDLQFDTRVPRPGGRQMIGKYQIIGKLGAGGMGTVHLGRSPEGQIVAVKVIHPQLAVDQQFISRFKREAALARRVAAFCTAPVLDFGEDADGPYLVTEYVDGIPLSRAVAERGPLPSSSVQGVAVGVIAALASIHATGLVHRDLKPGNVILSLCGPRVIDFGVARAMDGSSDLTRTGMTIGSPGWMAPEQARGEPVTTAADIFGWGCLVAFAATGRHPFGDGDSAQRSLSIMNDPPNLAGLPAGLYPYVAKAIAKRPEDRPSARALLSMLSGGGADLTELVQLPDLTIPRSVPAHVRKPSPVPAVLLAVLGAAALAVGLAYPSLASNEPPPNVAPSAVPAPAQTATRVRDHASPKPTRTASVAPSASASAAGVPVPASPAASAASAPSPAPRPSASPPAPSPTPAPAPSPSSSPASSPAATPAAAHS